MSAAAPTAGPTRVANAALRAAVGTDICITVTILDGATVAGTAIVQGNGNWSAPVTLTGGTNSLTARVTDAAGNTATSAAVVYTLSTTAPVVTEALTFDTGSSATDHITANDALSGTGLASTVVHFTIDGTPIATTVTANAQGAWSFTPSGLTDGAHPIVASQTDAFGNTGSASLTFTLDTTAPAVVVTPAKAAQLGFTAPVHALITGRKDERDRRIAISAAPRFGIVGQPQTITYRLDDQGVTVTAAAETTAVKRPWEVGPVDWTPERVRQAWAELREVGLVLLTAGGVGGIAILVIEKLAKRSDVVGVAELPVGTAIGIGLAQCLAMIPGVSRSGATITGVTLTMRDVMGLNGDPIDEQHRVREFKI